MTDTYPCPKCGHDNPVTYSSCAGCGTGLLSRSTTGDAGLRGNAPPTETECPECGVQTPIKFNNCQNCGTYLAQGRALRENLRRWEQRQSIARQKQSLTSEQ